MRRGLFVAVLACTAALAACGGGSSNNNGTASSTPTPTAQAVTVTETEFKIDGLTSLKAGDYTLNVQNKGNFPHDLHLLTPDGSEIAKTDVMQAGQSSTIQVTLKSGSYTYQCNVDGHAARGMKGTLTVS